MLAGLSTSKCGAKLWWACAAGANDPSAKSANRVFIVEVYAAPVAPRSGFC
jgi:hypothetical protein